MDNQSQQNEADLILYNAKIYTVNDQQIWAEAIAIKDGQIVFIGTDQAVASFIGGHTKMEDLKGKMVLPGIHDVHIHPLESGSDNTHFELDEEETDPENYAETVFKAAKDNPNSPWLIGYGHSFYTLLDATRPPREILDEVVSNRPVIIMEQTSHSMWVNSKALELAGITLNTENPPGGIIFREEQTDEPNGILIDNAGNMVMDLAMAPTSETLENDYLGLTEFMLPELAKHGITSICDARTYWKRDHHLTWQQLEKDGELTVRINLGLWAYPNENDARQIEKLKSLYSDNPQSLLRINQIKLYSDGIIHNTTAALKAPYLIDFFEEPTNNGLNYFTEDRLANYITQLEGIGFDFHIHAIGDRGVHEALNAIEQSATNKGRHRLTHVEIVDPIDYNRFNQLNVTADCQVAGDFTQPGHWHENEELIGSKRSEHIIPLKSLHEAKARITLSSDYSVSTYNPFVGIQNAVTRVPQELSLEEAIKAYTINAAYVMRQEDRLGSLEVGKEADLIVLDQNLFEIPASRIAQTKVLLTLLAGEEIYRK